MMTMSERLFRAALLLPAFAAAVLPLAVPRGAAADSAIEVPAYRQLGAAEEMSAPGVDGADYSANAGSLSGLTLLATIPAAGPVPRRGYLVQAQCAAGVTVAFDDPAGILAPTILELQGPSVDGGAGWSVDMRGMPHSGRIRIYSASPGCQMAARAW